MSKKMLRRSLALGALMAFVITGQAWAAEDKIAKGVKTELQSGSYDKIVGGVYLKLDTTANNSVELESTNITFNGEDAVEVLGGSRFNQVADVKSKIGTTNLTILGGNFGEDPSGSDNVPAGLVVGGDNLKTNDANNHNNGVNATGFKVESNITSANLKIQGGNFNSLILGGSSAIKFYGDGLDNGEQDSNGNVCTEYLKATVGTANTEITGGTFEKHIIVAGGMAWGKGTESTVNNAILKISNSTIGVDVYAGGVTWRYEPGEAIITNGTDLVIVNSEVKDIYGCNAYIYQNGDGQPWQYETNSNKAVNTTLSLSNVTAETVDIRKGSITLEGDNTIGSIYAGADTTVDVSGNTDVDTLQVEQKELNFNGNGVLDIAKSVTKGMTYTADDGVTEATVVYNNPNPTVTNTVIDGETITLTGVNLEVNSDYDGAAYSGGVIKNTTIKSDSKVTLNQNGEDHVLGQGKNTIEAEEIVLNAAAGAAIYVHKNDSATLEAKTITMTSNFTQNMKTNYDGSAAGVYAAGGTVDITGFDSLDIDVLTDVEGEGGHGIIANGSVVNIIGSENSSIYVDSMGRGALVALAAGELNIQTKNLTAGTTKLVGGNEVRKNSTLGAQGDGSAVNLTATGNVTLTSEEGMNAIGAGTGTVVTVDAAGDVSVNGQIEASGVSGGKRANVTIAGKNVSIDTAGEDAVKGFVGNIAITANEKINITSQLKDAIQADVANIELNAQEVKLSAGNEGWGINSTGDSGSDVKVNAKTINIVGKEGGIRNLAKSTIALTADDIAIDAGKNEALRAVNKGVIVVNADKSAAITGDVTAITGGSVTVNFEGEKSFLNGAVTTDDTSKTTLTFNDGAIWNVTGASRVSTFNSNQSKIAFEKDAYVHVDAGSGSLILTESGKTADDLNTVAQLSTVAAKLSVGEEAKDITVKVVMAEGKVKGETTGVVSYKTEPEDGYYYGYIAEEDVTEKVNTTNASINNILNVALMAWRAENNDMNKRLGELRNANGEHGVWVRMVNGESEYKDVENEYKTYQLGYDEKLSVDPSWTVGAAVSYTEADTTADKASGENKHKGFSVYGSKLNDDGSFVDLIAKVARIEHDFNVAGDKGDWSSNGYSLSAEYGKRLEQGNGLWIEPQIELTYGKISSAECELAGRTVTLEDMESLVGRVGFSLGKDIKQGNVYARASYLYDFEGETTTKFSDGKDTRSFEQDLGGGWWEVGVGANINLSKATYIYADVEKTFGGEVDTNWQWNLGVRYSF